MRVLVTLLALIGVLGWLGFESWKRNRALAQVFYGLAGLFAVMLVAAFFEMF